MLSLWRGFFFSVGMGAFVTGLSQISSFFSYSRYLKLSRTDIIDTILCMLCITFVAEVIRSEEICHKEW